MMERDPRDSPNRVPAASAKDAVLWAIPIITETGNLVEAVKSRDGRTEQGREDGEAVEPQVVLPTAEDVEKITQDAYQEGWKKGLQDGMQKGQEEGYRQGFEKAKSEGLREGKTEGLQQGIQQGVEQYKTEVTQKLTALNQLLTTLTHLINKEDYQLEQALLNIIKMITEAVIKRELSVDSKEIIQVIREAIAALPKGYAEVRVFVSESDLPLVREAAEHGGENWQVTLDETITNGGCRVETPYSIVDYTMESRFNEALKNVFNKTCIGNEEVEFEEAPQVILDTVESDPAESHEDTKDFTTDSTDKHNINGSNNETT